MRFAIVVVAACGAAQPAPRAITEVTVAPALPRLDIAEVVRTARIPHAEPVFIEPELIFLERVILWRAVPLASKPALARALAKLASAITVLPLPPPTAHTALHSKLAANRSLLTADGALQLAFLVRERVRETHELAVEAWRTTPSGPEPQLDHRETFATLDLVLARKPAPVVHALALYLRADALADLEDPVHDTTALATWLELVTRFPDVHPVAEASYNRIAQLAAAGLPDAQAHAIPANRWLATNATGSAQSNAHYRLGRLYDAERDRETARIHYCHAADYTPGRFVDQAASRLARGFLDTDLEPLRSACRAATCPCTSPVLGELIRELLQTEDDARAREVIELALKTKPSLADRARWSCDLVQIHERAGSPEAAALRAQLRAIAPCEVVTRAADSAESIHRYLETSPGLERCLDDRMARGQWRAAKLRLELVTGGDGRVERSKPVGSTFDPETTSCIERSLARHLFIGIARTTIAIAFRFEPP